MPTLATNQNRLSQINRNRSLAAALQQQALSFQPIQHQYQGLAKLAQALVANVINKTARKQEGQLDDERRKALAEALSPVTETVQLPGQITLEGFDDIPAETLDVPGRLENYQRAKTPNELLRGLPTDMAESIVGNVIQHQLTPPHPRPGTSGFANLGVRQITEPGQEPYEAQVFYDKDSRQVGTVDAAGNIRPIDTRYMSDPIDRTQDVPFTQADYSGFEETVETAVVAMNQMDRIEENILKGGLTGETALGGARALLDNAASTLSALGQTFDRKQERVMLDRGFYRQFVVTDEDRKKYSAAIISENEQFHKRFSALDAENQQIAISLAYTLARIADPGGRLSEMDVINQMRALGLDQASPERRIAALRSARYEFAKRIETRMFFAQQRAAQANMPAPQLPPAFARQLESILNQQSATTASGDFSAWWQQQTPDYKAWFINEHPDFARARGLTQ